VKVFVNTLTGSPVPNGSVTLFDGFRIRRALGSGAVIGDWQILQSLMPIATTPFSVNSTPPTTDQCRSSQAVQDGAPNSVRRQDAHTERVVTNRDSGAGSLWTVHYCYGDVESCDFKSGGGGGAVHC